MRLILAVLIALPLAPAAVAAQHVVRFCEQAQNQVEFNFCAGDRAGRADSALQTAHRRLAAKLSPAQARLLQDAQRHWEQAVTADCELEASAFEGGSIQPYVRALCHAAAADRRAERLRALHGESPHAGGAAGEYEVSAAAERLFEAMAARDTTALRTLLHPRALIVSVPEGGQGARVRTVDEWIGGLSQTPEVLMERMWDAEVRIDGDLATLWAPYDFHRGDRFSHCGMDAFQFVREGGAWKLVAVTFTARTTGCEAPPRWDRASMPR